MQKTFYLFRHGQTDYNKKGLIQGQLSQASLNGQGREDAARTAEALKGNRLEIIYSSPLMRARETADIVANALDLTVVEYDGLKEGHVGKAEGQSIESLKALFPDLMNRWYGVNLNDLDIALNGGETKAQIGHRILESIKNIAASTSAQVIGVATHGMAIRFLLQVLGHEVGWVENGEIVKIVLDQESVKYVPNKPLLCQIE